MAPSKVANVVPGGGARDRLEARRALFIYKQLFKPQLQFFSLAAVVVV